MELYNQVNKGTKYLAKNDEVLSRLIKKFGKCNLTTSKDYFNYLLRSIIGQQLSVASARAINKKFISHFGQKTTPEKIINTDSLKLRKIGLSNSKAIYVKELASAIHFKKLNLNEICNLENEQVIKELTKIKGIGIWTSHMFLIFACGRLNVLPHTDLGIRKAIMLNYNFEYLPVSREIIDLSNQKKWEPFESLVSLYLWKSLNTN